MPERVEFPPPSAPYEVARQLFRDYLTDAGVSKLAAWRRGWMAWRVTHWTEIDTAQLRHSVYAALSRAFYWHETKDGTEERDWNPDRHKVTNVLEALAAVVHLPSEIDPPAWINDHAEHGPAAITPVPAGTFRLPDNDAAQMISCRNGLLDLCDRTLRDHTPALFNLITVPLDYDEHADEPTVWLDFLASVWGDDDASILLLQEYFGYVLSGRLDMQKMLMLIGPTRSGKGTIARVLTKLMGGRRNVAGPTLASLSTNFGLAPLIGKPLAIISDARLGNIPSHTVVERMLSITGEDQLDIDRKYREHWTGKLPTRFVVMTNELPRFSDSSGTIAHRLLILQMTESFLGREDHDLDAKLEPVLGGILSWSLEGLDRLDRRGRFTIPDSSRDAAVLMMDLASPVSAFVRECCAIHPDATVARDELYAAWCAWAERNGHRRTAKSTFGRDLRSVVPGVKDFRPRVGEKQVHSYTYIALRPDSVDSAESADDETGHPDSRDGTKPLVSDRESGESGHTPNVAPRTSSESGRATQAGFTPPTGPGRCPECGCHVPTQGHKDGCSANK
jgi:putative DNA primase/helicase